MTQHAPHTAGTLPPEQHGYIPDKLKKAEKRIAVFPYDTEAWSVLIRDAQMRKIEDARQVYERLVNQFPNAGKYWRIYIEQELKCKNYERVEKLFQRCLVKVLSIDLWKLYLTYIKDTKDTLPSYREKMAQAYDFALDKMGMDIMSYNLWTDYINFLKAVEAVGSYAENQRITAVRKVFQRGVVNPMINIEALWKDYCAYETNINPLIAKKMTEDRGRDYMNSRRVAKEYEAVTRGLNKNLPSVPPQNSPEEATQVDLWKKYISWEKSNPLRTEDHALITKRVMFAYEQCLLCLGHHPDIWYEAASYLEQSSKILTEKGDQNAGKMFADEAAAVYERAITTLMKNNMLVYFAYADFEEGRMKYEKVHNIYKRLIAVTDIDPTLGYVQYMKFARRAEGIKSARLVFKMAREDNRTKYQVFVAASLMEYYCSKEKTVALKIFELGLKKYGGIPEYVLCYMEFMSHLNEDNNTRVLYERVLSSGQIQPEKSIEIWSRFLAFESEVGDLASIQKVEKRRTQAIEKVQEFEGKDTALLIDRYKYLDLYPCSQSELKAVGYYDLARQRVVQLPGSEVTKVVYDEEESKKAPEYPKPDVEQMLPFKPRQTIPNGSHPVQGGVFPPPPAAASLMTLLPPPDCFHGPFVLMDKFVEEMKNLVLPEGSPNDVYPLHVEDCHRGGDPNVEETKGNKKFLDSYTNYCNIPGLDFINTNPLISESDSNVLHQNNSFRTVPFHSTENFFNHINLESFEAESETKYRRSEKRTYQSEIDFNRDIYESSYISVQIHKTRHRDNYNLSGSGSVSQFDDLRDFGNISRKQMELQKIDVVSDLPHIDNDACSNLPPQYSDENAFHSSDMGSLIHVGEDETVSDDSSRIVWPEEGMACHIPGCKTEVFKSINAYFKKHWRRVHVPTTLITFCPDCNHKFKHKTDLRRHLRSKHKYSRTYTEELLVNTDRILPNKLYVPTQGIKPPRWKPSASKNNPDENTQGKASSSNHNRKLVEYESDGSIDDESANNVIKARTETDISDHTTFTQTDRSVPVWTCHTDSAPVTTSSYTCIQAENSQTGSTKQISDVIKSERLTHQAGIDNQSDILEEKDGLGMSTQSYDEGVHDVRPCTNTEMTPSYRMSSASRDESVHDMHRNIDTEMTSPCGMSDESHDRDACDTDPSQSINAEISPSCGMFKESCDERVHETHPSMSIEMTPSCGMFKESCDERVHETHPSMSIEMTPSCGMFKESCDERVHETHPSMSIEMTPSCGMFKESCDERVHETHPSMSIEMTPSCGMFKESCDERVHETHPSMSIEMTPSCGIMDESCGIMGGSHDGNVPDMPQCNITEITPACGIMGESHDDSTQDVHQTLNMETSSCGLSNEANDESVHDTHLSKNSEMTGPCEISNESYDKSDSVHDIHQSINTEATQSQSSRMLNESNDVSARNANSIIKTETPSCGVKNSEKSSTKVTYQCFDGGNRIVWPDGGMSCHIPGCKSEHFKSLSDYMYYHWRKFHVRTISVNFCPRCSEKFTSTREFKQHMMKQHNVGKDVTEHLVNTAVKTETNSKYISPKGIPSPCYKSSNPSTSKSVVEKSQGFPLHYKTTASEKSVVTKSLEEIPSTLYKSHTAHVAKSTVTKLSESIPPKSSQGIPLTHNKSHSTFASKHVTTKSSKGIPPLHDKEPATSVSKSVMTKVPEGIPPLRNKTPTRSAAITLPQGSSPLYSKRITSSATKSVVTKSPQVDPVLCSKAFTSTGRSVVSKSTQKASATSRKISATCTFAEESSTHHSEMSEELKRDNLNNAEAFSFGNMSNNSKTSMCDKAQIMVKKGDRKLLKESDKFETAQKPVNNSGIEQNCSILKKDVSINENCTVKLSKCYSNDMSMMSQHRERDESKQKDACKRSLGNADDEVLCKVKKGRDSPSKEEKSDNSDVDDIANEESGNVAERMVWPEAGMACHIPGCTSKFFTGLRSYIDKHWKRVHIPTVRLNFCPTCNIKFINRTSFKKHVMKKHKATKEVADRLVLTAVKFEPSSKYISPGGMLPPVYKASTAAVKPTVNQSTGTTKDSLQQMVQETSKIPMSECSVSVFKKDIVKVTGKKSSKQSTSDDSTNKSKKSISDDSGNKSTKQQSISDDSENKSTKQSISDDSKIELNALETFSPNISDFQKSTMEIGNGDNSLEKFKVHCNVKGQMTPEKVIKWPDGGMACPVPGCKTEIFTNYHNFKDKHWKRIHNEDNMVYKCFYCTYTNIFRAKLKSHLVWKHRVSN